MSARPINPITLYRREKARAERRGAGKAYQRTMQLAASEFRRQCALPKPGRPRKQAPAAVRSCTRCLDPVEPMRGRRNLVICDQCASPKERAERAKLRAFLAQEVA